MGALKNLKQLENLSKDIKIAIETGSGYGTGIYELSRFPFQAILSVEIENEQAQLLNYFFRYDSRIRVFNSKSDEFLINILSNIPKDIPILFFLDSHFPGADLGNKGFNDEKDDNIRLPLWKELQIIKNNRPNNNDIIICDDISLYDSKERQSLYEGSVVKNKPNLAPKESKDWISEFIQLFPYHKSEILLQEQGYLILTPNV